MTGGESRLGPLKPETHDPSLSADVINPAGFFQGRDKLRSLETKVRQWSPGVEPLWGSGGDGPGMVSDNFMCP